MRLPVFHVSVEASASSNSPGPVAYLSHIIEVFGSIAEGIHLCTRPTSYTGPKRREASSDTVPTVAERSLADRLRLQLPCDLPAWFLSNGWESVMGRGL